MSEIEISAFRFEAADGIPNNSRLPLLIYKRAVTLHGADPGEIFEELYPKGGWYAAWRYGVYPFPHYHSTAHEVLGVYRGSATLRLGHTAGITMKVQAGDVIVIPAGVGHQNLDSSNDFHVVGGYPNGQEADLLRGKPGEREFAERNIAAVRLPDGDPIFGQKGELLRHWLKTRQP